MADTHLPEDEATLYVLGELPAARLAEFEARMADSAELRQLVRELGEGAVALSLGSPQRRPPAEVWTNIEKIVSRANAKGRPSAAPGIRWWRNGWAVAAMSIAGWVLYAVFVNERHGSSAAAPRETTTMTDVARMEDPAPKPPLPVASNANAQLPRVPSEENTGLRLKIAQLEMQTGQLSQLVVQQRTLLSESNRVKFYQLIPGSNGGADAVNAQLTPVMQRAVLMSLSRELGWMPASNPPRLGPTVNGHATVKSIDGVDFVDLRPAKNEVGNQSPTQPSPGTSAQQALVQPGTESQPADVASVIPAYVSGDKLVVALDPSVVPAYSTVTFSANGANPNLSESSVVMGSNPMVVTVPNSISTSYSGGLTVTVGTVTSGGLSNSTQFFVPANP